MYMYLHTVHAAGANVHCTYVCMCTLYVCTYIYTLLSVWHTRHTHTLAMYVHFPKYNHYLLVHTKTHTWWNSVWYAHLLALDIPPLTYHLQHIHINSTHVLWKHTTSPHSHHRLGIDTNWSTMGHASSKHYVQGVWGPGAALAIAIVPPTKNHFAPRVG